MERKWWTLIAVCIATFMLLLDITVVNTALPAIQRDLGASFTDLQWVIDAYTLTLAAFVLTAGSLADRLGRRLVFAIGLGIFTVASLLCALATDPTFLNLARALQGVGGAVMFAVSLALIAQEFTGPQRGVAMGIYGGTIGAAVATGPLVGGALTEAFGWESVFYLNVPIGIGCVVMTMAKLRESRDPEATRVDLAGLVTFSLALFLVVFALLRGNEEGWGSTLIVGMLVAAGVVFAAFIAIERVVREPMLPLGLFRIPSFAGVQLAAFAISGSQFALFVYITFYLQNILGLSPLEAGVRYLPITITSFIVAPIAGALLARVQARFLMSAGLGLAGLGLALMSGVSEGSTWTTLLAGFLVGGAGIGLLNPPIATVAVSVVPDRQTGMASGVNDTFRQVGISVGIAAYGALFLNTATERIQELAPVDGDRARELAEAVSSGSLGQALAAVPEGARSALSEAARDGFLVGFNEILIIGAALCFVGALAALVLVRSRDMIDQTLEARPPEPPPAPRPS